MSWTARGSNGASWALIAARSALKLRTLAFLPLDHDGKIRMDCTRA